MKKNNDMKQYLYVMMTIIVEIYKMGMGTFLILFVPQKCDEHTCQIIELVQSTNIYNRTALCINAFTLSMIFFVYLWEIKRERWFIKNLDSDKNVMYDNIRLIANEKIKLSNSLRGLNLHYIRALRMSSFVCFLNLLSSGYIIYPRYLDISTLTSYVSFALLLLMKLSTSYNVGKQSYHSSLALSSYMTEPLSFNVLDIDEYPRDPDDLSAPLIYDYHSLQVSP